MIFSRGPCPAAAHAASGQQALGPAVAVEESHELIGREHRLAAWLDRTKLRLAPGHQTLGAQVGVELERQLPGRQFAPPLPGARRAQQMQGTVVAAILQATAGEADGLS